MSTEPTQSIEVAIEADAWFAIVTDPAKLATDAIHAALHATQPAQAKRAQVSVLLCDDDTIADLNKRFRGIAKPTNVLSFPTADDHADMVGQEPVFLGDIAVAAETLQREAAEQGKTPEAHLTHLLVHGTLHLLGFDHQDDAEADEMEDHERAILASIGIADPYRERDEFRLAEGAS